MSAPSNSSPHPQRPTMSVPHARVPIRSTTFDHEGWMRAQQQRQKPELEILSEGSPVVEPGAFESEVVLVGAGPNTRLTVVCPPPPKASPPSKYSRVSEIGINLD